LGEGTFGEAFKAGDMCFKIVPMGSEVKVNGEAQKVRYLTFLTLLKTDPCLFFRSPTFRGENVLRFLTPCEAEDTAESNS
jgi:hypothetical protein